NLGFERRLWEEIGGFDTSLSGTGGDETEMLLRAWAAGYRIRRVPEAIVHYRLRPGLRSAIRQRYRQGRAQMLMRLKPGGKVFFPTPPTVRTVLVALLRLLAVLPRHLGSDLRRHQWLGATALQLGRLVGLVKYRSGAD